MLVILVKVGVNQYDVDYILLNDDDIYLNVTNILLN